MAAFANLEDSPMFQKQVLTLEQGVNELRDRCQKLYKGCNKFMVSIGDSCNAENTFADALEAFAGGQDDPVSVSVGGPILSKFVTSFRELATYKEFLRSQVEHVLIDRIVHFLDVDLQDAKEFRRQLEKASYVYDQSRDRFVSLKKNTREDIVEELEEDLKNSKSVFERSRFNLVNALMTVEAKRKYEFLDSISAVMDAHLRYFKLGYELFSQMEPYINQVLAVAQYSKEQAIVEQDKLAKRIQEFRTQAEMDSIKASSYLEPLAMTETVIGLNSSKSMDMFMQSANGEVQIIKQGYLLKRSSNIRGDWKRRFFILNNQGNLCYYRSKSSKSTGLQHHTTPESGGSVFSRFRSKPSRSLSHVKSDQSCQVLDLRTSKLKVDADDIDLRLCFRIITPIKTYTLQAENAVDRMEWVNMISGAIASLLNSHIFNQECKETKSILSDESGSHESSHIDGHNKDGYHDALNIMREIPGNDLCAECSVPDPDWASLNLGILFCIECSGAHRNLGVHISKVRSLTLDVKVWEPTILELFRALGNNFCNSVWESMLLITNERVAESKVTVPSLTKPCPRDSFHEKEKYIHAKYGEKKLLIKDVNVSLDSQVTSLWKTVKESNVREVYRLLVLSEANVVNSTCPEPSLHPPESQHETGKSLTYMDPAACPRKVESNSSDVCPEGISLLHLACKVGNAAVVELLLLFGADVNYRDAHGRTPLHHCICRREFAMAKFLLRRGASAKVKDGGGLSVLERAMEMGAITDEHLFIMLTEN